MYQTYLWKLKPASAQMTLWQSDTIYGHLLCAAALLYGREEYDKMIEEFQKLEPPFIVSDGLVGENFPLFHKNGTGRKDTEYFSSVIKKSTVETVKILKKINKIKNISLEEFNKLRDKDYTNKDFIVEKLKNINLRNEEDKQKGQTSVLMMHNVINRCSGTTEEDGVFSQKETFINGNISVFIKKREDYPMEKLESLLKYIEDTGFGKKISSGKGAVERVSFKKFDQFKKIKDADGFVILSNYVPKEDDYLEIVSSSTLVKRGKTINEEFPFKKPFACFTSGSLFKGNSDSIKGKVLTNVYINEDVVQIGIPFTLEVKL